LETTTQGGGVKKLKASGKSWGGGKKKTMKKHPVAPLGQKKGLKTPSPPQFVKSHESPNTILGPEKKCFGPGTNRKGGAGTVCP